RQKHHGKRRQKECKSFRNAHGTPPEQQTRRMANGEQESAPKEMRGGFQPEREELVVAADLPPFQTFERSHFFRAVVGVPLVPRGHIGGHIFIGDFAQGQETPTAHLRGSIWFCSKSDEFRHHARALIARKNSTIGYVAACAVAHVHCRVLSERNKQV